MTSGAQTCRRPVWAGTRRTRCGGESGGTPRFVSAVESEAGRQLDEAVIKQLTGGDTITARYLYKEYFEFKPEFKIFLVSNHKPVIRGAGHANHTHIA
jgi:hypothetical protein